MICTINKLSSEKGKVTRTSLLDTKLQWTFNTSTSFRIKIILLNSSDSILTSPRPQVLQLIFHPVITLITLMGSIQSICNHTHTPTKTLTHSLCPAMVHIIVIKNANLIQSSNKEGDATEYLAAGGFPHPQSCRLYSNKIFISVIYISSTIHF